jgi:hypothetical protein
LQIGAHNEAPRSILTDSLGRWDFDFDSLFEGLGQMDSYIKLTIAGKTQVLMKLLAESQYSVAALPAIKVIQVTEAEHRSLEVEVPLSFHDCSRYTIVPVVGIRKGLLSFGLPPYHLVVDANEPDIVGLIPDASLGPVTTFSYGSFAYFVAWDGSADFPKDQQWFSHPAVRAVIRKWKAQDGAWMVPK